MITPQLLEKYGCTSEKYRPKFSLEKEKQLADGPHKLVRLIQSRIRDGVNYNLTNARLWYAIDKAYDCPFYQTTWTLMRGLIEGSPDTEKVLQKVKDMGMTHLLTDAPCGCGQTSCTCSTKKKILNVPTFFQLYVPIVMAYHNIRWAKIFNDRDQYPGFKYEPIKYTIKNKVRGDLITDRIQMIYAQYGYRAVKRQTIFNTLLYASCLQFPMESWHRVREKTMGGGEDVVVKEGIRYAIPHPSRMFWDLAHRPDTINSDTGCDYAAYWHILKYGDVSNATAYWNKDKISYGGTDLISLTGWKTYLELFPCTMSWPDITPSGVGGNDREANLQYYSTNEIDKAVALTEMFMKIVPKDYGLSDYDQPLWHRFVVANDSTILFCEPFCYNPVVYYGCDSDGNRSINTGMGLQILPFQDMMWNYLTQMLLSIKSNLRNVTFFDPDIMDDKDIQKIKNLGDKSFTDINLLPKSRRELGFQQRTTEEAFWSVTFPRHNVQEISSAIKMMLDLLERVLQFSPQEIGQAASHEQSATESNIIDRNMSGRASFTGGFIDDGFYAWKQQLYYGMMAYSNDNIMATIAINNKQTKKALDELGFKIEEGQVDGEAHAGVSGPKSSLTMEGIASTRDGIDRVNGAAIGSQIVQLTQALVSNPEVFNAIGVNQIVDWFNQAASYMGMPNDFMIHVRDDYKTPEQQQQDVQQQLAAATQQIAQQEVSKGLEAMAEEIKTKLVPPIVQSIEEMKQAHVQMAQVDQAQTEAIKKIDQILASMIEAQAPPLPPPASPMTFGPANDFDPNNPTIPGGGVQVDPPPGIPGFPVGA